MDKMEMLLPCPFCGGEASVSTWETESLWSHNQVTYTKVCCDECDISFSSEPGMEVEAPVAWNTRAALTPAPLPDDVAAVAQEDRVAAANALDRMGSPHWRHSCVVLDGNDDGHWLVQFFATHRATALASYASRLAAVEGERDALGGELHVNRIRLSAAEESMAVLEQERVNMVDRVLHDVVVDGLEARAATAEARAEAAERALGKESGL